MKGYRTLIINIATGLSAALAGILLYVGQLDLEPETTAWVAVSATVALSGVNTVLRFFTDTKVGAK